MSSEEDNCCPKRSKQHFESSPNVAESLEIQDSETETLNTKQVPSQVSFNIFEILKIPLKLCYAEGLVLEDIDGQIRPGIRSQVEEMVKMSSEDNNNAKSDEQHFESSPKVDEPLDIQDAETDTLNTNRASSPVISKCVFDLFKNHVVCPHRGVPLVECLGSILRPEDRRQIEKWIESVEYVDVCRRPTRKQELNEGRCKRKSSASSDVEKKRQNAISLTYAYKKRMNMI